MQPGIKVRLEGIKPDRYQPPQTGSILNEPDGTVLSLGFVKMALFRCRVVKVIRRNKIIFRIMISTLVSTVITPTVPPDYLTIISYLTRIQFHSC